jgi:choline dehydrogenase-like flavoprotein
MYDVIVIGSGASGSWAAKELCERGLNVLMLEAGRAIDITRDFSAAQRGLLPNRLEGALKGQHIQVRSPNFAPHTRQFYVNDRLNPYTYPSDKPFHWIRGRQLGGRLHTWYRAALRMSDNEFAPTRHGRDGPDWPISYRDLEPYYDKVEGFLGLLGLEGRCAAVPDGKYSEAMQLTAAERRFVETTREARNGFSAMSTRIIRHNAKRVPLPLTAALATGKLAVRTNAPVSHILTDKKSGRAIGVSYVDCASRTTHEEKARAVVLCASAFESVRILLNSACSRHSGGIGNSSGLLGIGVSDHLMLGLTGRFDQPAEPCESGDRADPYDFGADGLYLHVPHRGRAPKAAFGIHLRMGRPRRSWSMLAFGEMAVSDANRISIDPTRKDAWGIPVVRIECAYSTADEEQIDTMMQTMLELAEREGLEVTNPFEDSILKRLSFSILRSAVLSPRGAFWPGTSIHETGGARMGADARSSVLNRFNQCWDAPNVVVCDGSAFPRGGFQHPTLTIMAQTVRACDHLATAFTNGEV